MQIKGLENVSGDELKAHLNAGGRFVIYQYCISIVFMSFKRSSDIYFIRPGQNALAKGLPFTFTSLLLGWWGIPWGPIWTVATIFKNSRGGINVTDEVARSLSTPAVAHARGTA